MSQYMATEEETSRRPIIFYYWREEPMPCTPRPFPMLSSPNPRFGEEIPRVSTLPPVANLRDNFSDHPQPNEPGIFPIHHQYKSAKKIRRVQTLPSLLPGESVDGKLAFPDRMEKHPCANNLKIFNQVGDGHASYVINHVATLGDSPFEPGLLNCAYPKYPCSPVINKYFKPPEMDSHKRYEEHGRDCPEQLALDHKLVMDCLRHYNSMCPDDEYEPAPGEGEVIKHCRPNYGGIVWIHGNFVARRKCSGSSLPGPQTLFFYELQYKKFSTQVITCTPLLDGGICNKPCLEKGILACDHEEKERVCEMCYCRPDVRHPSAGEFAFGKEKFC